MYFFLLYLYLVLLTNSTDLLSDEEVKNKTIVLMESTH